MQKLWHELETKDVLALFDVDVGHGLSTNNLLKLREKYGTNNLPEAERRRFSGILLRQFLSPLIYLLIIAALIALAIGHGKDAAVIFMVIFLNSLIGAVQEGRAEASLAALKRLINLSAKVTRDSQAREIAASDLLPGDIIHITAGDGVPTDGRVIEAHGLQISEASLTGESLPITKKSSVLPPETSLADRVNMVYAGTYVTSGRGVVVAVSTGKSNELGKIAAMTGKVPYVKTRLEARIHDFGKMIVKAAVLFFLLTVILGAIHGMEFSEIFMIAISQMVSIVPEGLPVAMTIALAVGVQRMAKRRTIVRRLSAVETLGSTTVICSDKTGTLTRNEMTVVRLAVPGKLGQVSVTGTGYSCRGDFLKWESSRPLDPSELLNDSSFVQLMGAAVCCNDADLFMPPKDQDQWQITGDPTEAALLVCAEKSGLSRLKLRSDQQRRRELSFDPNFKMMATEHDENGRPSVYVKGAPEAIFARCQADQKAFSPVSLEQYRRLADSMAADALRVLAFGVVKDYRLAIDQGFDQLSGRIEFLGLVAQMDPPRDEVRAAITEAKLAGIKPIMITGDHKVTAVAIAGQLGIADASIQAMSGDEIQALSLSELSRKLENITVFARVHPEQKLTIVRALQASGHVVAMTGDGVNDAPALVQADVGVAMGMSGTEVAKEAAKIVITDDNFATIIAAIAQGRLVYQNIKKLLLFLFVTSIDELVVLLLALLFGFHAPLAAVQILWINLVSETALTVNLIMEPMEGDEMRRLPTSPQEPLFDKTMLRRIPLMVSTSVFSTFGWFLLRSYQGAPTALVQSETFTMLVVCQWFNLLNCRSSTRSALSWNILGNKWLLGGLIIANILHGLVIYWQPLARFFHTEPISMFNVFAIGVVASFVLWVEEIRKIYVRRSLTS